MTQQSLTTPRVNARSAVPGVLDLEGIAYLAVPARSLQSSRVPVIARRPALGEHLGGDALGWRSFDRFVGATLRRAETASEGCKWIQFLGWERRHLHLLWFRGLPWSDPAILSREAFRVSDPWRQARTPGAVALWVVLAFASGAGLGAALSTSGDPQYKSYEHCLLENLNGQSGLAAFEVMRACRRVTGTAD